MIEDREEIKRLLDEWAKRGQRIREVTIVGITGLVIALRRLDFEKTEAGYVAGDNYGYVAFQSDMVDYVTVEKNRWVGQDVGIHLNLKGAR